MLPRSVTICWTTVLWLCPMVFSPKSKHTTFFLALKSWERSLLVYSNSLLASSVLFFPWRRILILPSQSLNGRAFIRATAMQSDHLSIDVFSRSNGVRVDVVHPLSFVLRIPRNWHRFRKLKEMWNLTRVQTELTHSTEMALWRSVIEKPGKVANDTWHTSRNPRTQTMLVFSLSITPRLDISSSSPMLWYMFNIRYTSSNPGLGPNSDLRSHFTYHTIRRFLHLLMYFLWNNLYYCLFHSDDSLRYLFHMYQWNNCRSKLMLFARCTPLPSSLPPHQENKNKRGNGSVHNLSYFCTRSSALLSFECQLCWPRSFEACYHNVCILPCMSWTIRTMKLKVLCIVSQKISLRTLLLNQEKKVATKPKVASDTECHYFLGLFFTSSSLHACNISLFGCPGVMPECPLLQSYDTA